MPHLRPLPPAIGHGPFRFAEAVGHGVSRNRLRHADVTHPHHGAYDVGTGDDLITRCERLLPLLNPSTWFSHATAARLWRMPLPTVPATGEPHALHVLTLAGRPPVRRPEVVGWETREASVPTRVVGLVPIVAPADVWCQLAVPGALGVDPVTGYRRRADEEWLVAIGDFLVSGARVDGRRAPLCSPADLRAAVRRHRGKRGAKALVAAVDQVREPVDSPWETFTRLGLVGCGLPEPEVQVAIVTAAGIRHADLGYRHARVAIEFQGDEHRRSRTRWQTDLTRVQLMQDAGWRVLLVGAHDVKPDCRPLAERIRRALAVAP